MPPGNANHDNLVFYGTEALAGANEAFTELYAPYIQPVLEHVRYLAGGILCRVADPADHVAEVEQRVLISAWHHAAESKKLVEEYRLEYKKDPPESFMLTFLLKKTKYASLDEIRKLSRQYSFTQIEAVLSEIDGDDSDKPLPIAGEAPSPEDQVIDDERLQLLVETIYRTVPYRLANFVLLRLVHGYSSKEAAAKTGMVSSGAAGTQYYRQRPALEQALRAVLAEWYELGDVPAAGVSDGVESNPTAAQQ